MPERIIGDDGESSQDLPLSFVEDTASRIEGLAINVEVERKKRESIMLKLMARFEKKGGNLYKTVGEGTERLVVFAIPYVTSKGQDKTDLQFIAFARTGFYSILVGDQSNWRPSDIAWVQNPLNLQNNSSTSGLKVDSSTRQLRRAILGEPRTGGDWIYKSVINCSQDMGLSTPSSLTITKTLTNKPGESYGSESYKITPLSVPEFEEKYSEVGRVVANAYNQTLTTEKNLSAEAEEVLDSGIHGSGDKPKGLRLRVRNPFRR